MYKLQRPAEAGRKLKLAPPVGRPTWSVQIVARMSSDKISVLSVTVIKEGLKTPTAVEPAGDTIWIAERGAGKAVSIPMPK